MKEQARPHSVKLIGNVLPDEGKHSADILHAGDLRTEAGLWVEVAVDKLAEFFSPDLALAVYSNTAGPGDHFTRHVSGGAGGRHRHCSALPVEGRLRVGRLFADRPGGDVILPGGPVAGLWVGAVLRILTADWTRQSPVRSGLGRPPLVPGGEEGGTLRLSGLDTPGVVSPHTAPALTFLR